MSERHFRRPWDRYEAEGADGLIDRRRGRVLGRRVAADRIAWVLEQDRTRSFDFTVKHFHERLVAEHRFALGYTWTKAGAPECRPGAARQPAFGASQEAAAPSAAGDAAASGRLQPPLAGGAAGAGPDRDLDDATSEIYSAFLVEEEDRVSSLRGLTEVIGCRGLFSSLYSDRGSHYFVTPKAGGKVAEGQLTQVGAGAGAARDRAHPGVLAGGAGVEERVFGTLQGRLPQELRVAGITSLAAANRFLSERFVPAHNHRFAVAAAEPSSAFVPYAGDLAEILCVQAERVVGNDNCVRYGGLSLQIPAQRHRHHFVKVKVRVHAYADGSFAIFHGPRCLARYEACGRLSEAPEAARNAA